MSKKKFGKFIFGAVSLAAACGAAFYFVKDYLQKKEDDYEESVAESDFDGFDDDDLYNSREYVTINITHPEEKTDDTSVDTEDSDGV